MPVRPRHGFLLAVLAYLLAAVWIFTYSGKHTILWLLVAQHLILLPAVLVWLRTQRNTGHTDKGRLGWNPKILFAVFALLMIALPLTVQRRLATGDGSAYRFQARIFASGRLAAEAPPRLSTSTRTHLREPRYHHHIISGDKWFSKYPPGWPAILAAGELLKLGWLVNPIFGFLIAYGTYRIASQLYGEQVALLAVFFLIASPFFALNCMGFLSHPSCSGLIVLATVFFFRGLRSRQIRDFVLMLVCLGMALLIRPSTTAFAGPVLGCANLWALRRQSARALAVAAAAAIVVAAGAILLLLYNHELTGSFTRSTYALYFGTDLPPEITSGPRRILPQIRTISRWSIEATMAYAFPFLFLLAGYGLWKNRRRETLMLGGLFAAVLAGRFFPGGPSGSLYGERYYFETFFALAILGAVGWSALESRWVIPLAAKRNLAIGLLVVQAFHYAFFVEEAYSQLTPYKGL